MQPWFYPLMAWLGWGYAGVLTTVVILASWKRSR